MPSYKEYWTLGAWDHIMHKLETTRKREKVSLLLQFNILKIREAVEIY
jgi:hypothetical protein